MSLIFTHTQSSHLGIRFYHMQALQMAQSIRIYRRNDRKEHSANACAFVADVGTSTHALPAVACSLITEWARGCADISLSSPSIYTNLFVTVLHVPAVAQLASIVTAMVVVIAPFRYFGSLQNADVPLAKTNVTDCKSTYGMEPYHVCMMVISILWYSYSSEHKKCT